MYKVPSEIYETSITYLRGDDFIIVSSTDFTYVNKILKLHAGNPDNVIIKAKNADGSIVAKMPKEYLSLRKPVKRSLTEEQRQAFIDRMASSKDTKEASNS